MITRRQLVVALGAGMLAPLVSFAQGKRVYRVGVLTSEGVASSRQRMAAFAAALREFGYVEGGNLVLTYRYADGDVKLLPALADELAATKPDVIFAPNTISVLAAKKAAATTPIVFSNAGDPVADGLVASLARPGGNITGTTNITTDLAAKRLEMLKAAIPSTARVAVLIDNSGAFNTRQDTTQVSALRSAAKALGIQILSTDLLRRDDFNLRSAELKKWSADALYIVSGPNNMFNRALHAEFATRLRLPAVGAFKEQAEAGTLMSYGPSFEVLYRRAAYYVDRILKGAKPADLPVEQPTVFELVVNLKTARVLGVKMPQTFLIQATTVID